LRERESREPQRRFTTASICVSSGLGLREGWQASAFAAQPKPIGLCNYTYLMLPAEPPLRSKTAVFCTAPSASDGRTRPSMCRRAL
jgi:hypothetical protein